MALRFIGKVNKTIQVDTVQVTAYHAATTYTLTCGGKTVSVIAQGTVNATASALSTAWNASTEPEMVEITASVGTDTVTLTADTAGKPFTVTSSVSGGTGTIGSVTASTANSSPEDFNTAGNYSTGALPTGSDDLIFDAGASNGAKWRLGSLSAVTLTSLTFLSNFEYDAGLPELNTDGDQYPEYRPTYIAIGATTVNIGDRSGLGQGSGRIKLNNGSIQAALNVYSTGSPADTLLPAFIWKGTHASNVLNLEEGSIGVALFGAETATIATIRQAGGSLVCGSGTTLTTITQSGGSLDTASAIITKTHRGGTHTHRSGALTTLTITNGTVDYRSDGTITTLTVSDGGVFDAGGDPRALTITNCTLNPGATLSDPFGRITFTNPISVPGGLGSVTIIRGGSTNLQFS